MNEPKPQDPLPLQQVDATLSRDPLKGLHLGDYVVQERLGAGGMGVVYSGIQPMIGKRVAIKILQWEMARNPEEAERLIAEARLVNAIRHRGIVDIFSSGQMPDGRRYLVMELLEGDPMDKVIAQHAPLGMSEALQYLDEVCDALSAAHGAGVIHRDLKPNNVFLVSPQHGSRYIKLLDFGLAKKSVSPGGGAAQTRASMVVGTPYYMAPEQARGESVTPQTDLYSLGVMAFEMLTGKLPFDAPTPFEVITMHLNTPAPPPSSIERSIHPDLDELVVKLLAKVPTDRPASADYLRRELIRIKNRLQSDATQIGGMPLPTQVEVEAAPGLVDVPVPDSNSTKPIAQQRSGEPMHVNTLEYGAPALPNSPARRSTVSRASRVSRMDVPKDLKVSKVKRKRRYLGLKIFAGVALVALVGAVVVAMAFPELLPFKLPFPTGNTAVDIPAPPPDRPEDQPKPVAVPAKPEPEPAKLEPPKPEPKPEPAKPLPPRPDQPKKPGPKLIDGKMPRVHEPPTQAQLLERIGKHLSPLEAMAKLDGEAKDPIKLNLLRNLKERALKETSAEERTRLEKDLEDWEAQFRM